jgi:ElaB/YqjD/DUF883 family membrane-anchored ribosome-binding protein
MEVYFKELISKDTSLDKLVDDLERVVQGADDFAKSLGAKLAERPELARRLQRLKDGCQRINEDIIGGAQATDQFVRKNPYAFIGGAAVLGLLAGFSFSRRK